MINDITGLQRDPRMAMTIAHYDASVIIMHMKGDPKTMQESPSYEDLIGEIRTFFEESLKVALGAGIGHQRILLDPGIGFGKMVEHNLEILRRLDEFLSLGFPLLIGTSRKSLIGRILNRPVQERVFGTAATTALAIAKGASFLRVHDVRAMADVARMTEAILFNV